MQTSLFNLLNQEEINNLPIKPKSKKLKYKTFGYRCNFMKNYWYNLNHPYYEMFSTTRNKTKNANME